MDSSSRFRFRDQGMGDSTDRESTSDGSSESSIGNDESKLESMTGKGIKRLCSELLELKRASEDDFHKIVYSNYSTFVRIFGEVGGMENELMQLKQHVSTQRKLVKDLMNGIYLEILSKESIQSIIEESADAEESPLMSKLEVHTIAISETLDVLLLEHKLDEALEILLMEAGTLQIIQLEEDPPSQVLTSYNYAISERKSRLADQFALVADHLRVAAPELQKALVGLCKLGESYRATQLLLKFYCSRLANGIRDLQCSKSFLLGTYITELAKLVFSAISQAAMSFVVLYGETSPYASELIQWACEETGSFVCCFHKYVKSISEINGGLSAAVEAVRVAISFCSLLETQKIVLRPCLIKLIRPCMEEVLHVHIDHFKKVIGIFTATDAWVLGKYLISGILKEEASPMTVGHKLEYCLLTNSGRKFVTLLQAIMKDISPLVILQMEYFLLKVLVGLFGEYIDILERAIPNKANVREKGGPRINLAQTLSQQLSVLATSSTLSHFFVSITRSTFKGLGKFNGELVIDHAKGSQQEELDDWIFSVKEVANRPRACFFQQFIHRVMSPEGEPKLSPETYVDDQGDFDTFQNLMPSAAFQVLFLELRQLEKLAKDIYIGVDWLVEELLRELMETFFAWLSNNQEFWSIIEESSILQQSSGFEQFVLDMQFLVEIARFGGYFSDNLMDASLALIFRMESVFIYAGRNPNRDEFDGWATNAATEAIRKLQEIEETELPPMEDSTVIFEDDPDKYQYGYASDPVEEDARSSLVDSLELEDGASANISEAIDTEQGIQNFEVIPPEEEGDMYDEGPRSSTDWSIQSEDMGAANAANAAIGKLEEIEEVQAVESPADIVEEISDELRDEARDLEGSAISPSVIP